MTTATPEEFINPAKFEDHVGRLLALIDADLVQKNDQEVAKILGLVTRMTEALQTINKGYKQQFDAVPTESQWKGFGAKNPINIDQEGYYASVCCLKRLKQFLKSHQVNLGADLDGEGEATDKVQKKKSTIEVQPAPGKDDWLTTENVCAVLKVTARTVQNYRDDGKLPFRKTGRLIYYRREDVEAFITHYHQKSE